MRRLFTRSLRPPPDDITPNDNPAGVPPASVGPPDAASGDPDGVSLQIEPGLTVAPPSVIMPSAWDGWPAEWWPPAWGGRVQSLTDLAWACIDTNARALAQMPPYLVGAAPTIDAGWLTEP